MVESLGLRENAPEAEHHSRAVFAHVKGLRPMDEIMASPSQGRRLHDGTFHHMFEGGWMWVIPFDNFDRSTSKLASVGLMLDPRIHPKREGVDAETEFHEIVARFPDMAKHMEGIQTVRPFVGTGRLQYAASTSVGDRFLLSPSTYGFVDALYSNGLVHTFESVHFAAHHLLSAFGSMEGDAARGDLWLQRACFKFFASGNVAEFDAFLKEERPGADAPLSAEKQALLDDLRALMTAGSEGVADQMFARIRQESWLPRHVFDWGNPQAHNADFSRPEVVGPLLEWGFTASPEALREGLFDFPMPPAMA